MLVEMKQVLLSTVVCLPLFLGGCTDTTDGKAGATNWTVLSPPSAQGKSWHWEGSAVPEILGGAKAYLERKLANTTNGLERDNITAILSRWDSYCCQLFPVMETGSKKRVAVLRFFPAQYQSEFKNWRTEPVMVKGGGYGSWTVSYNPETSEYSSFGVNAIQ